MQYELAKDWKPNFSDEAIPAGTVIGEVNITVGNEQVTPRMLADGIGLGLFRPVAESPPPPAPPAPAKGKAKAAKPSVVDE